MRFVHVAAAAALLALAHGAHAQELQQAEPREAIPQDVQIAVPRSEAPAAIAAQDDGQVRGGRRPEAVFAAEQRQRGDRRTAPRATPGAAQRGSRPRGDNPATGTAVPRSGRPPAVGRDGRRDAPVYRGAPPVFNNNYYYPRRAYPYGYGAFGLGYFYYDPYAWGPGGWGGYYGGPSAWGAGGGYGYPNGQLRLRVDVKQAEVFVDGYYAGIVDDFDGIAQALTLEEGPYHVEIVAPGYEPLTFDVRIVAGRKTTYRGELRRQ